MYFNFMAGSTICSDFEPQENKTWHWHSSYIEPSIAMLCMPPRPLFTFSSHRHLSNTLAFWFPILFLGLHTSSSVCVHSIMSDSLYPMDWVLPGSSVRGIVSGKNALVGCHFILQGISPTQGLNPNLLHWQVDSLPLSHLGSPFIFY